MPQLARRGLVLVFHSGWSRVRYVVTCNIEEARDVSTLTVSTKVRSVKTYENRTALVIPLEKSQHE